MVLREAVATPYRDLVTRPTGVAVRHRVLDELRGTPRPTAHLDFSEVGTLDYSCADEVVAKLIRECDGLGLARVMLLGVREHHADAIEHALVRLDLIVVAILADAPGFRLMGAASDDWRAAFGAVGSLGRTAAPPLAGFLEWSTPRATQALNGLARHRCLVAHPDDTFELMAVA